MSVFFAPATSAPSQTTAEKSPPNMADDTQAVSPEGAQISRTDLEALGTDIKQHFATLIEQKLDKKLDQKLAPITQELKSFKATMSDIASTANKAFEMASALENRVNEAEGAEKHLKDRIAWLESRARALNLKIRGVPESADLNSNLASTLSTWLSSFLNLGTERAPTIVTAYRVGPISAIKPNYPRDIILQFMFAKEREAVLQAARSTSQVQFKGTTILFLLDLPLEILLKRKTLRPITDKLKEKKIRFRWNAASEIVVVRDGMQLKVGDLETGQHLLETLNTEDPGR